MLFHSLAQAVWRRARRLPLGLAVGLVACGGGGADAEAAADPLLAQWDFSQPASWQLTAQHPTASVAVVSAGELRLESAMVNQGATVSCPVAAAAVVLDDARLRAGALPRRLTLELDVRRWDLGLGRYDNAAPRLEVSFGGQRHTLRVLGFTRLPGTATLAWEAGRGWTARLTGATVDSPLAADVAPGEAPGLRLWIDGCSEGLRQALAVDALRVRAAW